MTVLPGNLCFCLVMSEAGNKEPTAFREKKTLLFSATLWMVECYVTKQAASVPPLGRYAESGLGLPCTRPLTIW